MADATKQLAGRVALVTGAGRGIGRGIALELAAHGAAVVVNYRRDADAAAEVVETIAAGGGRATAVQASISEQEEVDRLADEALAAYGGVDLLVANAGIASRGLAIADTDPAEVLRVMATHTFSTHRLVQRLLPSMRERGRSDVILVSSSELDQMRANGAPYNMAKAALEAFGYTLAHEEVARGVHVNIVAPGLIVTDMGARLVKAKLGLDNMEDLDADQPMGRLGRPEDVARVVRFLASEDAGFVTGQRIVVSGGVDSAPTG
ncbi:MAG TPA: SDR family oxidoreductase [Baekduia sp.]|uniref:SDR family NAD(P)-dependent oxidoreductase n=1 Tax=Baekduia sp. TaxID=2600305 RepID=UPI002D786F16|nr:SDR family oxidoreductase [Baekduia sp.]HET6507031.1 SDR family oxidoreductase [Baekduia sp.]